MSTALDMDPSRLGQGRDMMVATLNCSQSLATTEWKGDTAAGGTGHGAGLMVNKLLTRPKTSSSLQRPPNLHCVYGDGQAIQILGEKLSHPPTQAQAQAQARPRTSVLRGKGKDKPGSPSKERSGFVAVQGKELPLTLCTTHSLRSTGLDREIFSITTRLRNRSAAGSRHISSLIGPSSRDRSAAVLRELSASFVQSSREGPVSSLKDCLRDRWQYVNSENAVLPGSPKCLPLSPWAGLSGHDFSAESKAVPPNRCSAEAVCSTPSPEKVPNVNIPETSRDTTSFKDCRDSTRSMSSSSSKDLGDLTRRSSSPSKEFSARALQRACVRRARSSGNVLPYFALTCNEGGSSCKKDRIVRCEKELVAKTPRIITINRLPSPTPADEQGSKCKDKADCAAKPTPRPTPSLQLARPPGPGEDLPTLPYLHSSKETLFDSFHPADTHSPCKVTTFDMTISPLMETLPSPRARTCSMVSSNGQPVSVQDDTVLKMIALYDQQQASGSENSIEATRQEDKVEKEGEKPISALRDNCNESSKNVSDQVGRDIEQERIAVTVLQERINAEPGDKPCAAGKDSVVVAIDTWPTNSLTDTSRVEGEELSQEDTARRHPVTGERILISPREGSVTYTQGSSVKVLPADAMDSRTIHVPERSDSSSSSYSSSSTPTVPVSSSDLLCSNGDVSGRGHGGGQGQGVSEDCGAGEMGSWDHRGLPDKHKLKELDVQGNKRPPSRHSSNKKVPGFDKVSYDREREELRPLANSLASSKQSVVRTNGIKNNLIRADQFLNQRASSSVCREEDLIAMGTLWNPSQLQTRGSSTATSSGKSTSAPNSGNGSTYTSCNSLPARRPINLSTTTSTRQLLHQSTAPVLASGAMASAARPVKEVEPKYSDPLSGANPTFQQRLMELAALEAETVRWERTKKIKKKPKQDRDS